MSNFDEQAAKLLAEHAYRRPVDATEEVARKLAEHAPLLGKEALLLEALLAAEQAHEKVLEEMAEQHARLATIKDVRSDCKQLAKSLDDALEIWAAMHSEGREGVAWFAHAAGEQGADWTGSGGYLRPIIAQFDRQLQTIRDAAWAAGHDVEFKRGRKKDKSQDRNKSPKSQPELAPLIAFAAVIRQFWLEHTGEERFGYEDGTRDDTTGRVVPVSTPARLLWEATQYLEQEYSLANVATAFEKLRAAPANC